MQTTLSINITIEELRDVIKDSVREAIAAQIKAQSTTEEELIKIEEVAEMLKVSKVTIFTWKKAGKIPFHRIARKIFFKRSEVLEALKQIGGKQ